MLMAGVDVFIYSSYVTGTSCPTVTSRAVKTSQHGSLIPEAQPRARERYTPILQCTLRDTTSAPYICCRSMFNAIIASFLAEQIE